MTSSVFNNAAFSHRLPYPTWDYYSRNDGRLSILIVSEDEESSYVEYGDLLNKAICIIILKTIAL